MSVEHEDLVGFALGALDADSMERVEQAVAHDASLTTELAEIRRHFALFDHLPQLQPKPALWNGIRDRLAEPAKRPFLVRFWMPAAAALLVAAALLFPRDELQPQRSLDLDFVSVHGSVTEAADADRSLSCTEVARIRIVGGTTVTMDAGTEIVLPEPKRLVLRTGRVFLEVPPGERGFRVEAGNLRVETTGTAFLVDSEGFVWVESGTVLCGETTVSGGEHYPSDVTLRWESPREWFTRPTLTARILDGDTIRVVIGNEMPDPLQVAPRTGGEPLFFASFGGRVYPLSPSGFETPLTLRPNTHRSFDLRLDSLPDREAVLISYPAGGVEVEATR